MVHKPKILVFAGSLRKESYNKKLARNAAKIAEADGAQVTYIDLDDYPLPIYNGDIEEKDGLPENALKIKKLMDENDGFIIASPEYNSSISAVLKNTIDWTSRKSTPEEVSLSSFIDKTALILSASPGPLGGLRGLVHLRSILGNINTMVLPGQLTIANATDAFDAQGGLKDPQKIKALEKLVTKLVDTTRKLKQ